MIKKKITKNTKAIVLVHLYGFSVDVNSFKKEIKNKNIKIIEDCAQAFGGNVNGKKTGIVSKIIAKLSIKQPRKI